MAAARRISIAALLNESPAADHHPHHAAPQPQPRPSSVRSVDRSTASPIYTETGGIQPASQVPTVTPPLPIIAIQRQPHTPRYSPSIRAPNSPLLSHLYPSPPFVSSPSTIATTATATTTTTTPLTQSNHQLDRSSVYAFDRRSRTSTLPRQYSTSPSSPELSRSRSQPHLQPSAKSGTGPSLLLVPQPSNTPSNRYTPYPTHNSNSNTPIGGHLQYQYHQKHLNPLAHATKFSPSSRTDLTPVTNISFEHYDPAKPKRKLRKKKSQVEPQEQSNIIIPRPVQVSVSANMSSGNGSKGRKKTTPLSKSVGPDGAMQDISSTLATQTADFATSIDDDLMDQVEQIEAQGSAQLHTRGSSISSAPPTKREEVDINLLADDEETRIKSSPSPSLAPPPTAIKRASSTTPIPPTGSSASTSAQPTPSPAPTPAPKKGTSKTTTAKSKAKTSAASKKKKQDGQESLLKASTAGAARAKGYTASTSASAGWGGTSGRAAAAAAAATIGGALDAEEADGVSSHAKDKDDDEEEEEVDTRLYCVCRELYDDRFMLGCENCDEWFHPNCLGLEDYQCDLLEHFYCANCRKADPSLKTTWKVRCANGITHPDPTSFQACWKGAAPPLSKYCSKECGIEAMERKVLPFAKERALARHQQQPDFNPNITAMDIDDRDPGVKAHMQGLWSGWKERKRREAVVLRVVDPQLASGNHIHNTLQQRNVHLEKPEDSIFILKPPSSTGSDKENSYRGLPPGTVLHSQQTDVHTLQYELQNLQNEWQSNSRELQIRNRELSFIMARVRLVQLAVSWSEKGENLQKCCFDERILMDGEEWEEWVEGEGKDVLEGVVNGEDGHPNARAAQHHQQHQLPPSQPTSQPTQDSEREEGDEGETEDGDGLTAEDEALLLEEDSVWCDGRRKCERHYGWQKLQIAECQLNRGIKEVAVQRLQTRLKHIREQIETLEEQLEMKNGIIPDVV